MCKIKIPSKIKKMQSEKKNPADKTRLQSLRVNRDNLSLFHDTKGSMISTVIYNLYIPATDGGVFDDLIIIDEMAIARILINSKIYGWTTVLE